MDTPNASSSTYVKPLKNSCTELIPVHREVPDAIQANDIATKHSNGMMMIPTPRLMIFPIFPFAVAMVLTYPFLLFGIPLPAEAGRETDH